jgi:glycine/D-amino acid oxidase-like deaminating enzyme
MRVCIIGGGLAGSLLAWRLARTGDGWPIDLFVGTRSGADATAASGGAVRCYENDPQQRRLAVDSMVELLGSPTLRRWSDYRPTGSVYLRRNADGLGAAVAEIETGLPGSVRLAPAAELAAAGWAGLPEHATAVIEQSAGVTSPAALRESVLTDGAVRRQVDVRPVAVDAVIPRDASISCVAAGEVCEYDVVVAATGAWTSKLLAASGLPGKGYRTKSIQYAVHPAPGWQPPAFVDETTGLYGRPAAGGGLLLGLPSEQWEVDPGSPPVDATLSKHAARLAADRFPRLDLRPARRQTVSADCYCSPPLLSLRSVVDGSRFFTFTGGSGGSAKTALAASRRAALDLVQFGQPRELASTVRRKGSS